MVPPAVDVELREVRVGEETAIPEPRRPPVEIAGGGRVADVVGAPVVIPRRAHAEPSVVTLPRKHADEHPVAVVRESVHDEVVGEVHRIEILAVAVRRVAPERVVPKHILELREPALDGSALGRVDLVAARIVEVQIAVALLRFIIANDLAVRRRLQDAILTGGVEELRLRRAVLRRPARLRFGIHAVQTQEPASRRAIRGERREVETVLPARDFLDDGIDAAPVGELQIAAVFVDERLHPAEAHPILVAGVAIQIVGEGVEEERGIPGAVLVGIVEHPVRMGRQAERTDLALAARLINRLDAVRLLLPRRGERAASTDADRAPHLRRTRHRAHARLPLERGPHGVLSRHLSDARARAAPAFLRDHAGTEVFNDHDRQRRGVVGERGTELDETLAGEPPRPAVRQRHSTDAACGADRDGRGIHDAVRCVRH